MWRILSFKGFMGSVFFICGDMLQGHMVKFYYLFSPYKNYVQFRDHESESNFSTSLSSYIINNCE